MRSPRLLAPARALGANARKASSWRPANATGPPAGQSAPARVTATTAETAVMPQPIRVRNCGPNRGCAASHASAQVAAPAAAMVMMSSTSATAPMPSCGGSVPPRAVSEGSPAIHRTTGAAMTAVAASVQMVSMRRGAAAMSTIIPTSSAATLPRDAVRAMPVSSSGTQAPAAAAPQRGSASCPANPMASSSPKASSMPSAFQYDSPVARRARSSPGTSAGTSREVTAQMPMAVMTTSDAPESARSPGPRRSVMSTSTNAAANRSDRFMAVMAAFGSSAHADEIPCQHANATAPPMAIQPGLPGAVAMGDRATTATATTSSSAAGPHVVSA